MNGTRVLLTLALALWCGAALRDGFEGWVTATPLPPVLVETSVEMRDRHGALMRVFPVEQGRIRLSVQVGQVDADFRAMLIAYEDRRFYKHSGVDPRAMLRAVWQGVISGRIVSGGSTLTMQVARLIENSGTGRWTGKLRQIRLALALERRLSKDEILALYLTHAPYGGALEGVRAGSLAWFGKEPSRLTQAQAALLVALPQSPETRRPDRHHSTARAARDRVLQRVGGSDVVHADIPLRLRPFPALAPHLADHLRQRDPLNQRHDVTLDATLQQQMERLMQRAVQGQPRGVSAAIVIAEHATGTVRASVGSAGYSDARGAAGFVDMTRALRSPGSTLKPFVYGLAFDQGLAHPDTLIDDVPIAFGRYAPQNFDGVFRGALSVRKALQLSLNIPPVLLTQELGPARLVAALRGAGAHPVVPGGRAGLAVALGGVGMTLNDLVQLYGGLAHGGQVQPLIWRDNTALTAAQRLMSRAAAWQVGHILANVAPPLGFADRQGGIAYKTGTSYGHRDAWAVGFDGTHVIGVWLGRPDGTPVPGAFGGGLAAPILFEAFGRIKARPSPLGPPPPETLILGTAALPPPLQRFRSRQAVFATAPDAPQVRFPPDGAVLQMKGDTVPLKLAAGVLPFTVLVDGKRVLSNLRRREALLQISGPGFAQISIIDAQGRSDKVEIGLK